MRTIIITSAIGVACVASGYLWGRLVTLHREKLIYDLAVMSTIRTDTGSKSAILCKFIQDKVIADTQVDKVWLMIDGNLTMYARDSQEVNRLLGQGGTDSKIQEAKTKLDNPYVVDGVRKVLQYRLSIGHRCDDQDQEQEISFLSRSLGLH